jgi:hypothetical protein
MLIQHYYTHTVFGLLGRMLDNFFVRLPCLVGTQLLMLVKISSLLSQPPPVWSRTSFLLHLHVRKRAELAVRLKMGSWFHRSDVQLVRVWIQKRKGSFCYSVLYFRPKSTCITLLRNSNVHGYTNSSSVSRTRSMNRWVGTSSRTATLGLSSSHLLKVSFSSSAYSLELPRQVEVRY